RPAALGPRPRLLARYRTAAGSRCAHPPGVAWRSPTRRLQGARRRQLAQALAGPQGRRRRCADRLQARGARPLRAEAARLLGSDMNITVRVKRFDPETDKKARWQEYKLDVDQNERVLDVLNVIKWEQSGSLAYRRSCAHGICGSDAMVINGTNRLACKVLVKDLGDTITIEPMRGLPVLKDLIVDMEPFFDSYKSVLPYFINEEQAPSTERLQSVAEREIFDATTKFILCADCTTCSTGFWTTCRHTTSDPIYY